MLNHSDRALLLTLARERIESTLDERPPEYPPPSPAVEIQSGAFVTLHTKMGTSRRLRGCIGHIESTDSLYETVKAVAYSAAFSDYRFPPLSVGELPAMELEISVLSPLERVTETNEIVPGTHGLLLKLGARSGLLLPQVAAERAWNRETFLEQTCRKAGLSDQTWRDPRTEIYRFTAEVFDESSIRQ